MKLWTQLKGPDGELVRDRFGNPVERKVRAKVSEMTKDVNRQVVSRATRALSELRNAELDVLKGQRSGRVYRNYPYKNKRTASAPGEPPARHRGALRLHWTGMVETRPKGSGMEVTAVLESGEKYAAPLEYGATYSKRAHYTMAARPFHDRIVERAKPKILQIYEASYR